MPSYACNHPTCTTYLKDKGYCDKHKHLAKRDDTHDPESKRFRNSAVWQKVRLQKLISSPVCEVCEECVAYAVHHIKPLLAAWDLRLTMSNLQSVCLSCHNSIEKRKRR